MENRDRDKVSQRIEPTDAGELNRETSERKGQQKDSSADFGQSIGRAEDLNSPEPEKDSTGNSPGRH